MRRLYLSVAVLALGLASVSVAPHPVAAAPLPAKYSAAAGGGLVAIDLDRASGTELTGLGQAVVESKMGGGSGERVLKQERLNDSVSVDALHLA